MLKSLLLVSGLTIIVCAAPASGFSKSKPKIQGSISVQGKSKSEYPTLAKISLQEAIAVVAKEHPGKVIEVSLDKEDGFLVYEFEILASDKTKKEVLIDAGNGKTLLTKNENDEESD